MTDQYRSRKRAIHWGQEAQYAVDPASYLAVPTMELGDVSDQRAPIATERFTARTGMTPNIPGPDSATYSAVLEAIGFASQAGDGQSPPTPRDHMDLALDGILGIQADFAGITVASHAGTALDLGSDIYDVGDLVALVDAQGECRWVAISADAEDGSYTLAWDPGITAVTAIGHRNWKDDEGTDQSSSLFTIYQHDLQQYSMPGCRITSCSLSAQPDQQARFALDLKADSFAASSVTGLPEQTGLTSSTPLRVACVYVNGVEVETSNVEVAFGLDVQDRVATCRETGRSDQLLISAQPQVTIQPVYSDAFNELKRVQTVQSVLVQLGNGARSMALYAPVAQVEESSRQDASGLHRISLGYMVKDAGSLPRWQVGRS